MLVYCFHGTFSKGGTRVKGARKGWMDLAGRKVSVEWKCKENKKGVTEWWSDKDENSEWKEQRKRKKRNFRQKARKDKESEKKQRRGNRKKRMSKRKKEIIGKIRKVKDMKVRKNSIHVILSLIDCGAKHTHIYLKISIYLSISRLR